MLWPGAVNSDDLDNSSTSRWEWCIYLGFQAKKRATYQSVQSGLSKNVKGHLIQVQVPFYYQKDLLAGLIEFFKQLYNVVFIVQAKFILLSDRL